MPMVLDSLFTLPECPASSNWNLLNLFKLEMRINPSWLYHLMCESLKPVEHVVPVIVWVDHSSAVNIPPASISRSFTGLTVPSAGLRSLWRQTLWSYQLVSSSQISVWAEDEGERCFSELHDMAAGLDRGSRGKRTKKAGALMEHTGFLCYTVLKGHFTCQRRKTVQVRYSYICHAPDFNPRPWWQY